MKTLAILMLLVMAALSMASYVPATLPVAAAAAAVPAATTVPAPAIVPLPVSHQFVTRNFNRFYVPTTTATTWPTVATYQPGIYYKYGGNGATYPTYTYTYPHTYPYGYVNGYYPYSNYGYSYKSVW